VPSSAKARSVWRYFDLGDCFVQIELCNPDSLELERRPNFNRASYRRMVIERCMPEFRDDFDRTLDTLFPDDPLMVEDLLYQLCVEVNPALDIHEVRLWVAPEEEPLERERPRTDERAGAAGRERSRLRRRARGLERKLAEHVLGQPEVVCRVAAAVRRAAAGLVAQGRPLASFLFTGRTGTGKTEMARTLARLLYGEGGSRLVRVDCSEYASAHEYSKLIGSPPGYVGHEEGGQLTGTVQERPDCVVLFDEVEKAHPRLHNLMLQILEEGELTDGRGRCVDFGRTLVILTSNCGADEISSAARPLGFEREASLDSEARSSITQHAIETTFSPEFLGRLDEVLQFRDLDAGTAVRIAGKKLFELAMRARDGGHRVAFTRAVARWVGLRGFSAEYGAREVRRIVQREIEPRIADFILEQQPDPGRLLRVRIRAGEPVLEIEG